MKFGGESVAKKEEKRIIFLEILLGEFAEVCPECKLGPRSCTRREKGLLHKFCRGVCFYVCPSPADDNKVWIGISIMRFRW